MVLKVKKNFGFLTSSGFESEVRSNKWVKIMI
jgi:hypothetical protein